MTKNKIPFLLLDRLSTLEEIASKSKNDALKFYKAKARNILFDLEAITRILRSVMGKEIMSPFYMQFKASEDQLGVYDYNEGLYNLIAENKKVPSTLLKYFKKELDKSGEVMQQFISREGWLDSKGEIYKFLKENLSKLVYPTDEELRIALAQYSIKELEKLERKYAEGELDPYDIENGLHEIRRKFRWVSMYAQVAGGWIQLRKVEASKEMQVYETKEILESRYNQLPELKGKIKPLMIDSPNFYALSWIIAELGTLKDEALKVMAINKAIDDLKIKDKATIKLIHELYNAQETVFETAPAKANFMLDEFFFKNRVAKNIVRDLKRSI